MPILRTPATAAPAADTLVIDLREPRRDDAAADDARHRALRLWAVVAVALLNVADLLSTKAFLAAGGEEANPIGRVLMRSNLHGVAKAALVVALAWVVWRGRPRLATTCALWFVVGVYATAVVVNLMIVAAL